MSLLDDLRLLSKDISESQILSVHETRSVLAALIHYLDTSEKPLEMAEAYKSIESFDTSDPSGDKS